MNQLEPNTLLQNRYLIGQMIGSGGMGEVYLAVDQRIGGPVVIKRTYFAGDDVLGGGFESEARALERLRHNALPKVTDHFFENGEQFIVMDHVGGDDLTKRLAASNKPFPLSWVMFWADQLLDAIVYLHSNEPPIIHRDIKPQNLKLTENNNVMLLDFGMSRKGVAKMGEQPPGGFAKPFAPLEQIRGIETNQRSDVYSLAATLYFLLTNIVPADAASRADAVLSGAPDPVRPAGAINPEVPQSVSEVIMKAMAVSHDQRFTDARSMQKALREAFARMNEEPAGEKTIVMQSAPEPVADTPAASTPMGAETIPFGMMPPAAAETVANDKPSDFDATIQYDGPIVGAVPPQTDPQPPAQAGIQTEVFIKPDMTFDEPAAAPTLVQPPPVPSSETRIPDATMPIVDVNQTVPPAPLPDATMPVVNLEPPAPAPDANTASFSDASATAGFAAPASPFAESGFGQTPPPRDPEPAPAAVAPVVEKKRSKGFLIGILVALFLFGILGVVGTGVAWYVYSGQGGFFGGSGTPTPTPIESPTPTATPTPLGLSDDNSNSATPTPTPSPDTTPSPEPTPVIEPTPTTPQTRPTLAPPTPRPTQIITPPTPRPTTKPTVKPTVKPTLRGREIPQ